MQLFYTTNNGPELAIFEGEECLHLSKSLRKKSGESIDWTDGMGNLYTGEIITIERHQIRVKIQNIEERSRGRDYNLTLLVAPTKQADRIEWMLEKAIEIGLDVFVPIICGHSEQIRMKTDRLERIAISAMKQSQQFHLPVIRALTPFQSYLDHPIEGQGFIAHCAKKGMPKLPSLIKPVGNITVCIGPEGDFSSIEISTALNAGYQEISLGNTRLRTETAGLIACAQIQAKSLET
ncbi:MAG: RsmE family RNA methyltransferase [Saprospiraceae bacterium]